MFIGIQKENPCFVGATREELENLPCVILSEIREVPFAEMFQGKIYLNADELKTAKSDYVRGVRNAYLTQYIDGVVSNPLRWNAMTDDEKAVYSSYRQYLLDYTDQENWWVNPPKTFAEWM